MMAMVNFCDDALKKKEDSKLRRFRVLGVQDNLFLWKTKSTWKNVMALSLLVCNATFVWLKISNVQYSV